MECDSDFTPRLSLRIEPRSYVAKLLDLGIVAAAREGDRVTGFAAFYANDPDKVISFLSLILVDKGYRSLGVGRLLIQYWVEHCRQQGFKTLTLEVNAEGNDLVTWYEGQGFEVKDRYDRSGHDALLMSMNLQ